MKNCKWCDNNFTSDISYQIYCSAVCRSAATKEKISDRYLQSKRQKRIGKPRVCRSCNKQLSIYNDEKLCNICAIDPKEVQQAIKDIKRYLNDK